MLKPYLYHKYQIPITKFRIPHSAFRIPLVLLLLLIIVGTGFIPIRMVGAGNAHAWPWSRDMFRQPSIKPYQKPLDVPSSSVPVEGRDKITTMPREKVEVELQNPVEPTEASLQNGERLFHTFCAPCHGAEGKGDGPVIKKGFYPVDLTAPGTQQRTDGYIYAYIRAGGKIMMPSYHESLSSKEAWDVINYVRKLQGKPGSEANKPNNQGESK